MEHQDFSFQYNKTTIYGQYFERQHVKGVLVLVHGMGEHLGRYVADVIPMFLKASYAVVTYDNIGHGKSGGKRGHCPSYDALMEILETVVDTAKKRYLNTPLFLYGHSMGGNLVLNYTLRKQPELEGVIATSPYLRLAFNPPKWKMIVGKIMLHILPSITLPSGLDTSGISRNDKEITIYKEDILVHDKISPMFSFPIMQAGEWAINNAHKLKTRTLLLHGTGDLIIDYKGTKAFHENATTTTLQLFKDGYHELHKVVCKKEMLKVVQDWFSHINLK